MNEHIKVEMLDQPIPGIGCHPFWYKATNTKDGSYAYGQTEREAGISLATNQSNAPELKQD